MKKSSVLIAGVVLSFLFSFSCLGWAIDSYEAGQDPWNLTQTTDILEVNPAWSPDCSKLAYLTLDAVGNCNVYCIPDANTSSPGTPVLISTGSIQNICSIEEGVTFNKAGDKIIFCADDSVTGRTEIWIANAAGSGSPTTLLSDENIGYLATSVSWHDPNNKEWIVYVKEYEQGAEEKFDLVVRELIGTSVGNTEVQITNLSDFSCDFPKWSYQGDKISFMKTKSVNIGDANYERADVYVLTGVQDIIAGTTSAPTAWDDPRLIQITDVMGTAPDYTDGTGAIMPAFSFDGSKVFYALDLGGNYRIDKIDNIDPDYNPLNAYTRNAINNDMALVEFDMYIANADGSDGIAGGTGNAVKFDDQYYNQAFLGMSPDGMWLSYMDDRLQMGAADIFIVPVKSTTICGAAGGTGGSLDGSQIEVDAGDVSSNTGFSIYKPKLTAAQESGTPFCSRKLGPADTIFDNQVNITIHYTDKELGSYSEDGLYIVKWNSLTSKWDRVSGTITRDATNNKITIPVSSFSIYGVEGSASDTGIDHHHSWYECAIATAAYTREDGRPFASLTKTTDDFISRPSSLAPHLSSLVPQLKILRSFRDERLVTNSLGRAFVELYYQTSPRVADFIRDKESLKAVVRTGLKPLVWVAEKTTEKESMQSEKCKISNAK